MDYSRATVGGADERQSGDVRQDSTQASDQGEGGGSKRLLKRQDFRWVAIGWLAVVLVVLVVRAGLRWLFGDLSDTTATATAIPVILLAVVLGFLMVGPIFSLRSYGLPAPPDRLAVSIRQARKGLSLYPWIGLWVVFIVFFLLGAVRFAISSVGLVIRAERLKRSWGATSRRLGDLVEVRDNRLERLARWIEVEEREH